MRHGKRIQKRPIKPTNAGGGLSSAINRDCVLQIFAGSTPAEIEQILLKAHFRLPQKGRLQLSAVERSAAADREAAAFLRTAEGARLKADRIEGQLKQLVADWFNGPEGDKQYLDTRAALLSIKLVKDPDLFTRACKQALDEQVEKWMRSPLGQAQLEQEKKRLLKQQIAEPAAKGPTWIERQLGGLKKDA